jgi:hypothetical protein
MKLTFTQEFIDTATGKRWMFPADVKVTETDGVYSFKAVNDVALVNTPTTLKPVTESV